MANKTAPTPATAADFIAAVAPPARRAEAEALDALFRRATGFEPVMWGPSIIGYGRYHYRYESGREGDAPATGFSPRKAAISVYIMPGYADFSAIRNDLGKHKIGKSCLYVNRLGDIDLGVLEQLVRAGIEDLSQRWAVLPR
jgi:Domain of unknown function (DU1801)